MAKTTLRQIEDRLRAMFTPGEQRKLVFWYDESASFENEVSQLNIPGVTVYRMEPRTSSPPSGCWNWNTRMRAF